MPLMCIGEERCDSEGEEVGFRGSEFKARADHPCRRVQEVVRHMSAGERSMLLT